MTVRYAEVDLVCVGMRMLISSVDAAQRAGAMDATMATFTPLKGGGGQVSRTGQLDRLLERAEFDRIDVVFSRHAQTPEPTPENLWRHEQVVESLMWTRTLLPSRFGTKVSG